MTKNEALRQFSQHLKYGPFEISARQIYPEFAGKFLDDLKIEDTDTLTKDDFLQYYRNLISAENPVPPSVLNIYVSCLRYFAWSVLSIEIEEAEMPRGIPASSQPKYIEPDRIRQTIEACNDPRIQAWIVLAYDCALNPGEIAALKFKNIISPKQILQIDNSTKDKTIIRYVPYSTYTKQILNTYCRSTNRIRMPADTLIFSGPHGFALPATVIQKDVKQQMQNMPFYGGQNYNTLRRAYEIWMREHGCSEEVISALIGRKTVGISEDEFLYVSIQADSELARKSPSPCQGWTK